MANLTNSNLRVAPHTQDISSINGLEARLSNIESTAGTAGDDIDALEGRMDTAENDISQLQADVANRYTKSETDSAISTAISSVYRYKGSVDTYSDLANISNPVIGDVYNVVAAHGETPAGTNYAWTGTAWDALGGTNDLSDYFNKRTQDSDIITEGTSHLFLTPAERTKLGNTSGVNTGDQEASDFDIKDLADSTNLRSTWSGKQDAIADLANIRSRAEGSIQATDATFVSNTVSEGTNGKVTITAADNKTVAQAETNNKAAISALGTAHNNLVSRVEAVEAGDDEKSMFAEVTMNGASAEFSNAFITAASFVQHTIVGEPAGYIYKEVEAGKVTVKSTASESGLKVYLLIMKNPLAS